MCQWLASIIATLIVDLLKLARPEWVLGRNRAHHRARIRLGRKRTNDGVSMTMSRLISCIPISGIIGGVTCAMLTPAMPQAVNSGAPAGGDTCAMAILIANTMPK